MKTINVRIFNSDDNRFVTAVKYNDNPLPHTQQHAHRKYLITLSLQSCSQQKHHLRLSL